MPWVAGRICFGVGAGQPHPFTGSEAPPRGQALRVRFRGVVSAEPLCEMQKVRYFAPIRNISICEVKRMSELFGLNYLTESEDSTTIATHSRLRGNYEHLPKIIDTLFKLAYFFGEQEDVETEMGQFQSFCFTSYTQAPYSFWIIFDLYAKGYYLEGVILFRHLLETFVQMRYFDIYPEKLKAHICDEKRVTFKCMFDEFSEGLYKRYYGKQLSEAAHGMLYKDIYRFERKSSSEARTRMGCEYNEDFATYLSNNMVALIFGYFNLFEKFYPNNTVSTDSEVSKSINEAKSWLEKYMAGHRRANPLSEQWYEHINRFIYY